jgi:hypothetical protein
VGRDLQVTLKLREDKMHKNWDMIVTHSLVIWFDSAMIVKHFLVILDMMDISRPPYSCDFAPSYYYYFILFIYFFVPWNKRSPQRIRLPDVKNVNSDHNTVPLDAFDLLFYELLEICSMCFAVRGMSLKKKTILF